MPVCSHVPIAQTADTLPLALEIEHTSAAPEIEQALSGGRSLGIRANEAAQARGSSAVRLADAEASL
jgi:hypothetical protein